MADQSDSVEATARRVIDQCRCEIARAWTHVEAAREALRRSRWMLARWSEEIDIARSHERPDPESLPRPALLRIGKFVLAVPETPIPAARRSTSRRLRRLTSRRSFGPAMTRTPRSSLKVGRLTSSGRHQR